MRGGAESYSFRAVALGFAVDVALTTALGLGLVLAVSAVLVGAPAVLGRALIAPYQVARTIEIPFFLIGLFGTAMGAYAAARVAGCFCVLHALSVGLVSTAFSIALMFGLPSPAVLTVGDWASLLLLMPFALIGGYIAKCRA
ncbi:MAG: hypothetical protein HYV63_31015 [Candidatus Schekmanbacteria bacterium]|nr:hypothetical protein [Candidatus Schekmanbacteria bacterium]